MTVIGRNRNSGRIWFAGHTSRVTFCTPEVPPPVGEFECAFCPADPRFPTYPNPTPKYYEVTFNNLPPGASACPVYQPHVIRQYDQGTPDPCFWRGQSESRVPWELPPPDDIAEWTWGLRRATLAPTDSQIVFTVDQRYEDVGAPFPGIGTGDPHRVLWRLTYPSGDPMPVCFSEITLPFYAQPDDPKNAPPDGCTIIDMTGSSVTIKPSAGPETLRLDEGYPLPIEAAAMAAASRRGGCGNCGYDYHNDPDLQDG